MQQIMDNLWGVTLLLEPVMAWLNLESVRWGIWLALMLLSMACVLSVIVLMLLERDCDVENLLEGQDDE